MDFGIEHGQVRFDADSVLIMHETPGKCFFLEIDMDSKYPGEIGWTVGPESVRFFFIAGPDTLHIDTSTEDATVLEVWGDYRHYEILADWQRYTARIMAFDRRIEADGESQ